MAEEPRFDYSSAYADLMETLNREMHDPELPEEKRKAVSEFRKAVAEYVMGQRSREDLLNLLRAEEEFLRSAQGTESWQAWLRFKKKGVERAQDYLFPVALRIAELVEENPLEQLFYGGLADYKLLRLFDKEVRRDPEARTAAMTTLYGLASQLVPYLSSSDHPAVPLLVLTGAALALGSLHVLRERTREVLESVESRMERLSSIDPKDIIRLFDYVQNPSDPDAVRGAREVFEMHPDLLDLLAYT